VLTGIEIQVTLSRADLAIVLTSLDSKFQIIPRVDIYIRGETIIQLHQIEVCVNL